MKQVQIRAIFGALLSITVIVLAATDETKMKWLQEQTPQIDQEPGPGADTRKKPDSWPGTIFAPSYLKDTFPSQAGDVNTNQPRPINKGGSQPK
jgi:hypothetical protein